MYRTVGSAAMDNRLILHSPVVSTTGGASLLFLVAALPRCAFALKCSWLIEWIRISGSLLEGKIRRWLRDLNLSFSLGETARPADQQMTTSKMIAQPCCTDSLSSNHNPMNVAALQSNMSAVGPTGLGCRCRLVDKPVFRLRLRVPCRDLYPPMWGHHWWSCDFQGPTALWPLE